MGDHRKVVLLCLCWSGIMIREKRENSSVKCGSVQSVGLQSCVAWHAACKHSFSFLLLQLQRPKFCLLQTKSNDSACCLSKSFEFPWRAACERRWLFLICCVFLAICFLLNNSKNKLKSFWASAHEYKVAQL